MLSVTRTILASAVLAVGLVALPGISHAQPAPDRAPAAARQGAPANMLQLAKQLDLSAEQQQKLEQAIREQSQKMQSLRDLEPEQRRAAMQEAAAESQTKLREILTTEQQAKLRELMQAQRGGQAGGPAGAQPIERIRQVVQSLDLTPEQQTKVQEIFQSYREEFDAIRSEAGEDRQAAMQKMRPLMQELREKIVAVLTPEQTEKFNEAMRQAPAGAERRGGPRAENAERPRGQQDQADRPRGERRGEGAPAREGARQGQGPRQGEGARQGGGARQGEGDGPRQGQRDDRPAR